MVRAHCLRPGAHACVVRNVSGVGCEEHRGDDKRDNVLVLPREQAQHFTAKHEVLGPAIEADDALDAVCRVMRVVRGVLRNGTVRGLVAEDLLPLAGDARTHLELFGEYKRRLESSRGAIDALSSQ